MLPPGKCEYLGLIIRVAKHLIATSDLCKRRIGYSPDEYVGIGYLGLLRAKANYRPGSAKFETYAFVVIRHFMMEEAFNSGLVRVPVYIAQEAARLAEGLTPTKTAQNRADPDTIQDALRVFNAEYHGSKNIAAKKEYQALEYFNHLLHDSINELDPISRNIIKMNYGLDGITYHPSEIAEFMGINTARIYVRRKNALIKLRDLLKQKLWLNEGMV